MAYKSPEEFSSLFELLDYFKDEQTCLGYLAEQRWQDGVECPYCCHKKVYTLQGANKRYKCASCRKQFTARANTIFEDSKLPLRKWFAAIYLILAHRKGISSYQLARDLKITQKSAWFLGHRIRYGIKQGSFNKQLDGVVESDETFVGGKNKNRHADKKVKNSQGRSFKDKSPVHGILQRSEYEIIERPHKIDPSKTVKEKVIIQESKLRCFVVPNTKMNILVPIILQNVQVGSKLMTDEWYFQISSYEHKIVMHSSKQYVNGEAHTNTLEGFWGLFKRSIIGIYHKVSPKHLHRYVDEAVYRYNTKALADGHKALNLLSKAEGSLKYKQLV